MKLLLIILLTMFCLNNFKAQSHNPGPNSNCKLNKNVSLNIEKISCPACDNIAKKETEAKAVENKKRADVVAAKAKVEKDALEKARVDKLAEDKKNAEASKVYINAPKNTGIKTEVQPKINSASKFMTVGSSCTFEDSLRHEILSPIGCQSVQAMNGISYLKPELALYQYGLVYFKENEIKAIDGCDTKYYYDNIDLVDYTGKRQFNNKYLNEIGHINDGWFILGIDSSDLYYKCNHHDQLYNIFTKKTILLERNWDWGTWYSGYCSTFNYDCDNYSAMQHFIPIFADSAKYSAAFEGNGRKGPEFSKYFKKMLLKHHPDVVTEQVLKENAIVLFVTGNLTTNYRYDGDFLKNKPRTGGGKYGYIGGYHGLLLISKNGTVKKINL